MKTTITTYCTQDPNNHKHMIKSCWQFGSVKLETFVGIFNKGDLIILSLFFGLFSIISYENDNNFKHNKKLTLKFIKYYWWFNCEPIRNMLKAG